MKHLNPRRFARLVLATALLCGIARAEAPKTASVLQLTPDNAQLAVAVPPLDATLAQTADLVKKFAPNPAEIDNMLAELVSGAAGEADAWGAANFKEIAARHGLNGDAPIGLFADFTKSAKKAAADYAKNKEEAEKAAAPADGAAAKPIVVKPAHLTIPDIAAVLTVADQDKATKTLQDLVSDIDELSATSPTEEKVGEITIKAYTPYGYFFSGDKLVLGSLDLVKGIAGRIAKPATISYGTKECPASSETEIAALVYGKRFFPLLADALPALKLEADVRPVVEKAVADFSKVFDSDDPLVLSLGVSPQGAELQSRIDGAKNKGLAMYSGEVKPLRLAQWLPENTLALVSLRFNAEDKKRLADVVLPGVAAAQGGGDANQTMIAKQVIEQIGDEITVGIAAADQDFPTLYAMISLAKPDETKGLLQMLVPAAPGEKYGDVDIQTLAVPIPIAFNIAYPGDMILLSNSIEGMKKVIDLQKSNGKTNFLASLTPPLDPATPRAQAIMINSKLITDVLLPLSSLGVKLPGDVSEIATKLGPVLHDVRLVNEVNGTWRVDKLSIHLAEPAKTASAK